MNYFIPFSLFCAVTIHAADQTTKHVTVYIFPENSKEFKPFEYETSPDGNIWDVARAIAIKHGLTVTGLYFFYHDSNEPTLIPQSCNYPLQQHLLLGLPLHILAKRNQARAKSSNSFT
jgi:hypothetical protein